MNAYELADRLDLEPYGIYGEQAANTLRQQADRIAELEKVSKPVAWIDYLEHSDLYDLNVSGRGIPLYTAPQIKELSNEEINEIASMCSVNESGQINTREFARAILKKASEK